MMHFVIFRVKLQYYAQFKNIFKIFRNNANPECIVRNLLLNIILKS